MRSEKFDIKDKTLLVVGPLYNQMDKLYALRPMIKENHIVVFLGDICFPYQKFSEVVPRVHTIKEFMTGITAHYVLGDKDLLYMRKTINSHTDTHDWLGQQNLAIRFVFPNNTSALIVHGGILPKHTTWSEINNDVEVAFISNLPQIKKSWHNSYNGRFGYVLSSHPAAKDNEVEKSKHSISLDTNAHESGKLAVQEFTEKGLGETIYI